MGLFDNTSTLHPMSERIGIIQVDGKIPNLALMKVATYHKSIGNTVEMWQGPLWNDLYDRVYASKIFYFSEWPSGMPEDTIKGGTGIDHYNVLPAHIEAMAPDYELWPECTYHLGFSMKGCRFACSFCVVPKKEGRPKDTATIDELLINPNGGNRLMLLDNDFFGAPLWYQNLERIIDLKLRVSFVQGLNIRILTRDQAFMLAQCNYQNGKFNRKMLSFAWDRPTFKKDEKLIEQGIQYCIDAGIPTKDMQFFVLVGYDSTPEQDLYRVAKLKEWGCRPFVMPYNKFDDYQKAFARWINGNFHKSCTWDEYKYNPERGKSDGPL
jgi:hypothetical protein